MLGDEGSEKNGHCEKHESKPVDERIEQVGKYLKVSKQKYALFHFHFSMLTNQVILSYIGLFMFAYSVHKFYFVRSVDGFILSKCQSEIDLEIQKALS